MGLTVHYSFKFRGTEEEVIDKLRQVRDVAMKLPFEEIDGPVELDYKFWTLEKYRAGKGYGDWRDWACIQYQIDKQRIDNAGRKIFWSESPTKAFCLHLWPGEGCEPMNIGLVKGKRDKLWRGSSFCKTQYAKQFLKSHLIVIRILDECKRIGILDKVDDKGKYYETRDLEKLAEEVNASTRMLQDLVNTFDKDGLKGTSPVNDSPTHVTKFEIDYLKKMGLLVPPLQHN